MSEMKKRMAPDGGWGWVIVVGFAVSNIISITVVQNFGLLFRYVFTEMLMTATDVSSIMNFNSAVSMVFGLFNGPIVKKLGYRKYAMIGSVMLFVGFISTSQATSKWQFVVFYVFIYAIGWSSTMCSFSLAMNTFFVKRRSIATGICTTLTGLGPVFVPLFVSKCMDVYGARGTAFILSALLLHSFAASLLLQPIKWHYKYEVEPEENGMSLLNHCDHDHDLDVLDTKSIHDHMENATYPRRISVSESTGRRGLTTSKLSLADNDLVVEPDSKWWSKDSNALDRSESGSTQKLRILRSKTNLNEKESECQNPKSASVVTEPAVVPDTKWYSKLVSLFDLDLLKDPVYRNIWLGQSLAFTGEIIFSLLTPLILGDRDFNVDETAKIMSCLATSDIIFRFLAPFVGNFLKLSAREMYMLAMVGLVAARLCLTYVSTFWATIGVCIALGVAKGFRTVYMSLVIPNYVSLEKLPSATGLQTLLNGIFLFICGPLAGLARDIGGSYNACIHLTNTLTISTLVLWSVEMVITSRKNKKKIQSGTT